MKVVGWKWIRLISGSCRAGSGYPDWGSKPASLPLSTDWLLLRCSDVTMMDPRPARFLFPVALLPVPAWWQTPVVLSAQLPWTDSPCTRSGGSYPWIWTGLPLPVGLFPLLVGLRGGAGRRHDNRLASGCNKTRFFHGESAEFTENIQNYAKNGKLRHLITTLY